MCINTILRWVRNGYGNFDPEATRNAFINKVDVVKNMVERENYNSAQNKLTNDVIPFIESKVTGPFRQTLGLLLESVLLGVIQPDTIMEIEPSMVSLLNSSPFSFQKIEVIQCKYDPFGRPIACEVRVPQPTLEDTLSAVSQALAMALLNEENRKILSDYMTSSPYKEHSLYFSDYLQSVTSTGETILKKMSLASGYLEEYIGGLVKHYPTVLLQFLDTLYYSTWIKNPAKISPYVTYWTTLKDDTEWDTLLGFNSKGEKIYIDLFNLPNYPILFVSPEPPESSIYQYRVEESPVETGYGSNIGENNSQVIIKENTVRLLMRGMYISQRCETGPMEIYTYNVWDQVWEPTYTKFPGVDYLNRWYQTPERVGIWGYDWRGKSLFRFNGPESWRWYGVYIEVWEEDWGWNDDDFIGAVLVYGLFEWTQGGVPGMWQIPSEDVGGALIKPYFYQNWSP